MTARSLGLRAALCATIVLGAVWSGPSSQAAPETAPTVTAEIPVKFPSTCTECLRGSVPLSATAGPSSGRTIVSVDFQYAPAGTDAWSTIGTDAAEPYALDWDTTLVPDRRGVYDVRAVVTDNLGETGVSAIARDRVVANGATFVSLADPGALLRGTVTLRATADAVGQRATMASFELSSAGTEAWEPLATVERDIDPDGNPLRTFSFDLNTTTLPDGAYDLRVVAANDLGSPFVSRPQRDLIVDGNPPTATLSAPGGPVQGEITLSATADDQGSGVASVRFERSPAGAETWVALGARARPPYTQSFDTRLLANGLYDLRVMVTDKAGNAAPSPVVRELEVSNPDGPRSDQLAIENVVAPAREVRMLGSVTGGTQDETWAFGITGAAPATTADGARLDYTARGRQIVLLRYTDAGGWQIADVLRNADGSAFQQDPNARLIGQMTPSGEAWIALRQQQAGQPVEVALFHRRPGVGAGRFLLDPAATDDLRSVLTGLDGLTASLRINEAGDGRAYGVLVVPAQDARSMAVAPAGGGAPVTISGRLDYGVLVDGTWSKKTVALPSSYVPAAGALVTLALADPTGPGAGWGAITVGAQPTGPLKLARFDGDAWEQITTQLDVLDSTDAFSQSPPDVAPRGLRADATGLWVDADVGSSNVIAYYDERSAEVTMSWCEALPRPSTGCGAPLDPNHPATMPDRVFDTRRGKIAVGLEDNFVHLFAHGDWTKVAAPGFIESPGRALFTAPDAGWVAGSEALGRITARPTPEALLPWPQANRSTLVSVALPPRGAAGVGDSGALAVGLDGTTLRYDADAGWLVEPVPTRANRVVLRGVAFSGPSMAFAVGQAGTILRWDGATWSEDPQSTKLTQAELTAVAFSDAGEGWAVGRFGTILHFDGESWTQEDLPAQDSGVSLTSVAVGGDDVFAVAGGNLVERQPDGTWQRVDGSELPDEPARPAGAAPPFEGDLRVVAGLPDGGVVAAGRSVLIVRHEGTERFEYSAQPLEGIAIALSAFRGADDRVRAFVSTAPPVSDDSGNLLRDVGGFPAGDGELLRQTATGWQDLSRTQIAGRGALPGDGVVKVDPVLAVAADSAGSQAWAVGGYAGTRTAAKQGTDAILPARPATWRTSAIWRYDSAGNAASPAVRQADVTLPAKPDTVSFAYFSTPMCKSQCASARDAQPDVNLRAAATQIASFAAQPGGPAFAVLGGNARGPIQDSDYNAGNGAFDFANLHDLLSPLDQVPLYAALGPRDRVPTRGNQTQPWADAFAQAPAPFGRGAARAGIVPAGSGSPAGAVNRYYAFDAAQNGGRLRMIVLDNSLGSLEDSGAGQTAWLDEQLARAAAAGVPVVVTVARPLRSSAPGGASDADALARKLAEAGVLAVFTTSGSQWRTQTNRRVLVPENGEPGAPQLPEYEGATLGYQQPQNNGVVWYSVSVNTTARTIDVKAIPIVSSLAIKPLTGLTVARSSTLSFEAIGRRPNGSLATPPTDDSFPGFDNYVGIPAPACSGCIAPSYTFKSSDPTIGDFVVPSGPGSRFPKLDSRGKPIPASSSGLFCAFNTGSTTISVTSGLLSSSLPVTVQAGDIGRPCGTVFRAGVNRIIVVPNRNQVRTTQAPRGSGTPPPPAGAAEPLPATLPQIALPVPPEPLVTFDSPPEVPVVAPPALPRAAALVPVPPVAVPPIPPATQPIPPGGSASAQAAARRKEKAQKHASQSAYATRPAGASGPEWFFPAVGAVSVLALLLVAGGMRPGPRPRPAMLLMSAGRGAPSRRGSRWPT